MTQNFLLSPRQVCIQIFLRIVANVKITTWKIFSRHSFTCNFGIGLDLQIIIWLLELVRSGWFTLPPTHIKSFFTIGASAKSELVSGKDFSLSILLYLLHIKIKVCWTIYNYLFWTFILPLASPAPFNFKGS